MNKSFVLVTGANGFVGNALCKKLAEEDYQVCAAVRKPQYSNKIISSDEIIFSNIGFDTSWNAALQDIDYVVHLAARVHVMNDVCKNPLEEYRKVNVNGTLNLALQAASAGVKRFIYLSSIKVNGEETAPGKPFTAEDDPAPIDSYAISKYEAEVGLQKLAHKTGMDVVIIRPPLVYGPGVKANFLRMMQLLRRGMPLPFGAINNVRSLVALENLVDFIILCIEHPAAANQIFLVSDGEDLSTTELLRRLAEALGVSTYLLPVPAILLKIGAMLIGKSSIARRICESLQVDISKSRELLGWSPPCSVDIALQNVANDYLAQCDK